MKPWTGAQLAVAVKAFYKTADSFVIAQCEFRREFVIQCHRAVLSDHAINTWVGSKPRGYWFYTKQERWWCKNSMYTQEYCGSERGHWKKSTLFCASPLCVTRAVWSQLSTGFKQRTSLLGRFPLFLQATKVFRESSGLVLLCFRPRH
jgi:hypothetical protein